MTWEVYGVEFDSGEMTSSEIIAPFKPKTDLILKAIRTWVIFVNDPTFTDLTMKIYSTDTDAGGQPIAKKLLYTSTNSPTKSEILTLANGVNEIYFDYDNIPLDSETLYCCVLNGTGYSPAFGSSFVAWRLGFPDPYYRTGLTIANGNEAKMPYMFYLIGGEY